MMHSKIKTTNVVFLIPPYYDITNEITRIISNVNIIYSTLLSLYAYNAKKTIKLYQAE